MNAVRDDSSHVDRFAADLIEAMPGILYLYDTEGRFLLWNRDFERVSGYSGDEIARMHPLQFFTGEDQELLALRIGQVFERGEASVEALFITKDGRQLPYFFTGRRIQYGGKTCLVGVGVDISERLHAIDALAASEERYRSTLDSILEGCQLVGFDGTYLYLNETAAKHNRRPNSELLGRRMPDVWPGIEGTRLYALIRRVLDERVSVQEELRVSFPGGGSSWFEVRAHPVPEGVFALSVDVSDRRRAEQSLVELNEALERKVLERTRELDEARLRAESADRLKSSFLATMSHELRTPLNSILGFTGILLRQLPGPLNEEQLRQLTMVQGSARHLLELINDVLDISKIEAGQLEIRSSIFELAGSLERVVGLVRPLAEKKQLTLVAEIDPALGTIEADRRRVEQILLNLLNNGVKFTDRGGVTLTARRVTGETDAVELAVKDTGMGIAEADLDALFQPFRQLDSGLERHHEGTGLGLVICRRLADLMGGTIAVESQKGTGSTFVLRLPARRAPT